MKTNHILSTSIIAFLLGGCAAGGHSEFSCPGAEQGVCTDAYTAMQLAEEGKTAKDFHRPMEGTQPRHSSKRFNVPTREDELHLSSNTPHRDVAPVAGVMQAPLEQPKPVLMPATVIEMWFDSYEDSSGILYMSQTAFAEVTPRRWSLRNTQVETFKTQGPFLLNEPQG